MQRYDTAMKAARLLGKTLKGAECWLWTGAKLPSGYGRMHVPGGTASDYAHRIAWEIASGSPIPPGLVIGHTCDTPACVRNDEPGVYVIDGISYPRWGHLFCATHAANTADRDAKGRGIWVGLKGEAASLAKLTDATVAEIRRRYAAGGISQRELAREFGVNQSQISLLVRGRTWGHVA